MRARFPRRARRAPHARPRGRRLPRPRAAAAGTGAAGRVEDRTLAQLRRAAGAEASRRGAVSTRMRHMLDPRPPRDDFEATRQRLLTRGPRVEPALAALAELDQTRRQILPRVESLKFERNQAGEAIARAKRAGEDATALLDASRSKADALPGADDRAPGDRAEAPGILLRVPNLPHASVPVGKRADDNVEVRAAARRASSTSRRRRTGISARARHPRLRARDAQVAARGSRC